jgi:hypothetical protein
VPEELWPKLAAAASFDAMRSKADQLAPEPGVGLWKDSRSFFDSGRSGKWENLLSPDELTTYSARIRELGDDALVDWLHQGAAAGGRGLGAGGAGAAAQ